jgi:single-strand DNA-binding protein
VRRIEIIGNVGRDGELKQTSGGTTVLNFSVAAKGSRKDDEAQWHTVALFGKRAEALSPYLKKGQRVFIRGEYKIRQWSKGDKSGVDVDVTADEVELLGERSADQATGRAPSRQEQSDADESLPF